MKKLKCLKKKRSLHNLASWWTNVLTAAERESLLFFSSSCSPFDVEDLTLSSGNVSKAAALQRRVSVYSQGTPDTPTFQDSAFFVSARKSGVPRPGSVSLFPTFSSMRSRDDDVTPAR